MYIIIKFSIRLAFYRLLVFASYFTTTNTHTERERDIHSHTDIYKYIPTLTLIYSIIKIINTRQRLDKIIKKFLLLENHKKRKNSFYLFIYL